MEAAQTAKEFEGAVVAARHTGPQRNASDGQGNGSTGSSSSPAVVVPALWQPPEAGDDTPATLALYTPLSDEGGGVQLVDAPADEAPYLDGWHGAYLSGRKLDAQTKRQGAQQTLEDAYGALVQDPNNPTLRKNASDAEAEYWIAVDNELRLAEEQAPHYGQDPAAARTQRAAEIKAEIPENLAEGWVFGDDRQTLHDVLSGGVDEASRRVGAETPAARKTNKALYDLHVAQQGLEAAQASGQGVEQAQAAYDAAFAKVLETLGGEFDIALAAELGVTPDQLPDRLSTVSDEQLQRATQTVIANHGNNPWLNMWINLISQARGQDVEIAGTVGDIEQAMADIEANLDDLTPLERQMWDSGDRATLAFLKAAGIDVSETGDGKLAITIDGEPVELTPTEQKLLAQDGDSKPDLRLLSLLLLGGIRLNTTGAGDNAAISVEIGEDAWLPVEGGGWERVRQTEDGDWIFLVQTDDGQWVHATRNDAGALVPLDPLCQEAQARRLTEDEVGRVVKDVLVPVNGQGWVPVRQNYNGDFVALARENPAGGAPAAEGEYDPGEWVPARRNENQVLVPTGQGETPLIYNPSQINTTMLHEAAGNREALSTLGYTLMPSLQLSPEDQLLLSATSIVRVENTRDQVEQALENGQHLKAIEILGVNMDAAFSTSGDMERPGEREQIWLEAGAPNFTPEYFRDRLQQAIDDPMSLLGEPRGTHQPYEYLGGLDKVGLYMQYVSEYAPPEVANMLLDVVKQEFKEEWYEYDRSLGSATGPATLGWKFFEGLSRTIEVADSTSREAQEGQPGPRAREFAEWLTGDGPAGDLLKKIENDNGNAYTTGSDDPGFDGIRFAVEGGFGFSLADAVGDAMENSDKFSYETENFRSAVQQGKDDLGEHYGETYSSQAFRDFEADKNRIVSDYFGDVLGNEWDVTQFQEMEAQKGEYWLQNFIGTAHGWTPSNAEAAAAGDHSKPWFTDEQHATQIDLISGWIREKSDDGWKIRAIPVIYTANRDGVTYGALFHLESADGKEEVWIDGLAAPQIVAQAVGNPDDPGDNKPLDRDAVQYHYESLRNFQDDNPLSEEGRIYLPHELVADLDPHGLERFDGVNGISTITAGQRTGWENFKIYSSFVIVPLGIAAAFFTGGTSLVAVGAWTTIGVSAAWGVGVTVHDLQTMASHGQTIGLDNPQARSAWIGLVGSVAGIGGSGLRAASQFGRLSRFGQFGTTAAPRIIRSAEFAEVGTGGYLTVEHGSALLANWNRMSSKERGENLTMFLMGAGQLSLGAYGLSQPMARTVHAGAPGGTRPGRQGGAQQVGQGPATPRIIVPGSESVHGGGGPGRQGGAQNVVGGPGQPAEPQIFIPGSESAHSGGPLIVPGAQRGDGGTLFVPASLLADATETGSTRSTGSDDDSSGGQPPIYRVGFNEERYWRLNANDGHVHHGGLGRGTYAHILDNPNAPRPDGLQRLLILTGRDGDPSQGPILAVQRVPHSLPEQAGYYLGRESPFSNKPVEIDVLLHSNGTIEIPPTTYYGSGNTPTVMAGQRFQLGEPGFLWDGVMPDRPAAGHPPLRIRANIIPDVELNYRGAQRDVGLIDEVLTLPGGWSRRVLVGSVAPDPADPANVGRLFGTLNYTNQVEAVAGAIRVFGIGEWTWSKEGVIVNLALKPDLHSPEAIHQLLDVVGRMGGTVVVHTDAGTPNMLTHPGGRLLLHAESNYANIDPLLNIFRAHPDVNFVWAHAGGLGRSGRPGPWHVNMLRERVLGDPSLNHVSIDMSWDVVSVHVARNVQSWARLIRDYPTRFLSGSDSVAADTRDVQYAALDTYAREGFLDALGPEATEYFLKLNFDRIFVGGADRVTAWRLANREWLEQFPWNPDEGVGPNPFDPQGPLGPNSSGRLWTPASYRPAGTDAFHIPGEGADSPANRLHASGALVVGAGTLGAGSQHGPDLAGPPAELASSPLDVFNPLADGSPADAMNSAAFALRGGLIIVKALYGNKLPSLNGDKPLGFLLRSGLLGTYLVNDAVFYQWLANGGLAVDPNQPLPLQIMEHAFILGFGAGNTLLTGTTALELGGGARGMNWDTTPTKSVRATGMSLLALASPLWTTNTGIQAVEEFSQGHPVRGTALSAATLMEAIFTAGMGRAAFNEWLKALNAPSLATNLTRPHIMLGASLFFATGINLSIALHELLSDRRGQPAAPSVDPDPSPSPTPSPSTNRPSPAPTTVPTSFIPQPTQTASLSPSVVPTTSPSGP